MSPVLTHDGPIPGGLSPPLHGGFQDPLDRQLAKGAEVRAGELLADADISHLLSTPRQQLQLPRARHVFVNRNLRMAKVELFGFDMDYTLAIYHMRRLERLSFNMTVARLITEYGYPAEIGLIPYDHHFGMRGLVVDKTAGNIIKMDRFGYVGRAYHGRQGVEMERWRELYRNHRVRIRNPQYAWIDTLFALPEACLYAGMIELLENIGVTVNYAKLYDDIREAIDGVHRDNSLKREIRKNIGHYIFKDPELGPALHKLRSGGKKLFLLTNSHWDYTTAVMSYLLDGVLAEYPTWRHYFDYVITAAGKPAFFSEQQPFLEVDATLKDENRIIGEATSLERWKVYQGGNLPAFEKMAKTSGESVLYVGDHIYGDILKSKKTSLWRTCMIVQEIEDEIDYTDLKKDRITRLSDLELFITRLDDEVNARKTQLNSVERKIARGGAQGTTLEELESLRQLLKQELDLLRKALRESTDIAQLLERQVEEGFNPYWGLLFKEGHENSRFGEQVEQYACLYTSRVSNFVHYSPMQYFRSPRDSMPHEKAGALTAKMSPLGSEGPPKGAERILTKDT